MFLLLRIWLNKGKVSTFSIVTRQLIFHLSFYVCVWTTHIIKRWKSLWRTDSFMELCGYDTAVCQGEFYLLFLSTHYCADGQIYNPNREVQNTGKEEATQTYRQTRNPSVAGSILMVVNLHSKGVKSLWTSLMLVKFTLKAQVINTFL